MRSIQNDTDKIIMIVGTSNPLKINKKFGHLYKYSTTTTTTTIKTVI